MLYYIHVHVVDMQAHLHILFHSDDKLWMEKSEWKARNTLGS